METGKIYGSGGKEFIVNVDYKLYDKSESSRRGELVPTEYKPIADGDGYVMEFQDGTRGRCTLKKRVNKAVRGVPPLYYYYFSVKKLL